ncbi:hypothetical protein QBC47DRAFT_307319 [Echria macrotheca]|uniref:S-adenosylmethionine-dependent methyltransferase-like protein n=1 Tax=Echria macrotheca TaxID=438768 RepID=A0AAJ0B4Y9_9PEZI|nr:hypothetical protein QBC47DRAFT_307319 [Echria macrotheca]
MPFHWPNKNRSQHNLPAGPTADEDGVSAAAAASATGGSSSPNPAAGAANPPAAALSNPAFSSSESFQAHPPQPPPHLLNLYSTAPAAGPHPGNISQLQHSNTVTGSLESRQQRDQRDADFADQVTRSQSHRYAQSTQISPVSTQYLLQQQQHPQPPQQQYEDGSGSAEDLSGLQLSPVPSHGQVPQQAYYAQQPPLAQPQPQPQRTKQSTRKLIKNILTGATNRGSDAHQQHSSQPSISNTAGGSLGLGRQSSKRVSQTPAPPPAIRSGVSQISLEQPVDWQNQQQQQPSASQSSPHQSTGEFRRESYVVTGADGELHSHNLHGVQNNNPTIRSVPPSDSEASPYSPDDVGYRHQRQSHIQLQGQSPSEGQHQQYGQQTFDPAQQQYQFANPQQLQYQSGNPGLYAGHLANPQQQQNAETVSQLSHESPVTDSDQPSIQPPQPSPAVNYATPTDPQDLSGRQNSPSAQQAMPPATGGAPPPRRSQETEKGMRDPIQPPPGPPPSYRAAGNPNMNNPLPPPPSNAGAGSGTGQPYRQPQAADRPSQFDGPGDIQGRNSPQPASTSGEDPEKAFKDLLTKYKNVKRLYFDGKKEIEHLNGQVEQLQNALANQRMSQSRTSLDDNEYTTRFNRLNGAINNLSFNIRKDWVTLPGWLDPFVSSDAIKTGKQEMTAVGRAVITRWLVDEIFNRCFHPGLNFELSRQLKAIEQNIRHFSYTMNSQEEFDALTSKVISWRMATLEGLQDVLRSGEAQTNKLDFTRAATNSLTNCLFQHLSDPPPAGVEGSAGMIVELAVGIAANMPMESRDVAIIYHLPESPIDARTMEVEKMGLPALENRPSDAGEDNGGDEGKDSGKDKGRGEKGRTGMLVRVKKDEADANVGPAPPAKGTTDVVGKVRFAGFVTVEVRGRQVLVKAPVWTI